MKSKDPRANSQHLLLVSGDGELEQQISSPLACAGISCTSLATATYGQDALKILAKDKPRLVVLDDNLPDISGLDFLRAVRQEGMKTLGVYTAAHHTLELEKAVRQLGVLSYTEPSPDLSGIARIATAVFSLPERAHP